MSARQLLILNLYEAFLVRPTRTLAPVTRNKHASSSNPHSSVVQPPLRSLAPVRVLVPRLPLPPCRLRVVGRDGVRSSAQLRSVIGKRFDAERLRLGRGDVGGDLVGIR